MSETNRPTGDGGTTPPRQLSAGRRWLFRGLTLLLAVGVLELFSMAVWQAFPPVRLAELALIQRNVSALGTDRTTDLEALHPYVGWVFNPDAAQLSADPQKRLVVNSLGFADMGPSIRRRSPERIVIGILGGSVAQQMGTIGEQALRARLAASPLLRGRTIELVKLAMSGFKQPQQLMTLNYVLALGGEFDVVVNVDGYNETGLVVGENDGYRVFAAYPRNWQARLQDVVDPRNSSISYRLLQIRALRKIRAEWIIRSPLRSSWTVSLVWAAQDAILRNQQVNLGVELQAESQRQGRGFARQGPGQMYSNDDEMYAHLTDIWYNSSLQMHHVCSGRGIRYLHVLQPNQYHAGSKRLSPLELRRYYSPDEDHAKGVRHGYPHLIDAGNGLRRQGVEFHDLTQLFAEQTDTIYSDYFCHYNSRGTNLLAEAVADRILKSISATP